MLPPQAQLQSRKSITVRVANPKRRKVYLPPMTDHALALVAAFQACGTDAELLPESDEETLMLGPPPDLGERMLSLDSHHRGHGEDDPAGGF